LRDFDGLFAHWAAKEYLCCVTAVFDGILEGGEDAFRFGLVIADMHFRVVIIFLEICK